MSIKTFDDYHSRIKRMKRNLYMGGERVGRDDERLNGQLRVIKETYDRANDPDFEDICTATSHLTGEKIKPIYSHSSKHR